MNYIKSLAVSLLLCLCPLCYAQQFGVVDKELQCELAGNPAAMTSVNIVLKSHSEPARIKAAATVAKDRRTARVMVVDELKAHSCKKQSALLEYLYEAERCGLVANISSHWIANAITCDATKEVVEALASHPDVLTVGASDDATSINAVESIGEKPVVNGVYDLCGRLVQNPKAGIYIVNGKKTVVK